ncbi:MAG TPA: DNA repair protein RadC [Gammaproteobacteria bacterium]|nr:DNA repair protein RadC [Gammaproteobacteria bacterium]
MAITDWPKEDRPREKLLQRGRRALSDVELLAIFLRTGVRGLTAIDLARELIHEFGGLRALLDTEPARLCQYKGVGHAKYVQLAAALELGCRYLEAGLQRAQALSDPREARNYLHARLTGYDREVFACLFLDNRHRVIAFEELFFGSIDTASVHAREVVKMALRHNAAAVIFAHNHPSGVAEPSQSDLHITRQLQSALALVEVRVLDHIVVGDTATVSLAERGQL